MRAAAPGPNATRSRERDPATGTGLPLRPRIRPQALARGIQQLRNRLLADVIAIRLTTTTRDLPTWVKLCPAEPLTGYANADCIEQLGKDELGEYLGAFSPTSMRGVNQPWRSR